MFHKLKSHKGISLIVLIITIVVILIIVGMIMMRSGDYMSNAKKAALFNTIKEMEHKAEEYYQLNGSLPVKGQFTDFGSIPSLSEQIAQCGDTGDTFYEIDLDKVGAINAKRTTDPKEAYIIASKSHNIYYAKGEDINNKIYHRNIDIAESGAGATQQIQVSTIAGAPTVTDVGNNGNGSDIRVGFTAPTNETNIQEYHIVVVPEDQWNAGVGATHWGALTGL